MKKTLFVIYFSVFLFNVGFSQIPKELNGLWQVKLEKLNYYRFRSPWYHLIKPEYAYVYISDSSIYFRKVPDYYKKWEDMLWEKQIKKNKYRRYKFVKSDIKFDSTKLDDNWNYRAFKLSITTDKINYLDSNRTCYLGEYRDGIIVRNTKGGIYRKNRISGGYRKIKGYRFKWIFIKVRETGYDEKTNDFLNEIKK